jgi:hypothetical protein
VDQHGKRDGEGSVAAFIQDLRVLRDEHGAPTWDAMARRAVSRGRKASRGTLHGVLNAGRLPTELAVAGFVAALTEDAAELERWLARRARLAGDTGQQGPVEGVVVPQAEISEPKMQPHRRPRLAWILAATVLVLTNLATGVVVYFLTRPSAAEVRDVATVATGDDPGNTACLADARVASDSHANPTFLLEILFSLKCQAGWARVTRYDSAGLGNKVTVTIYRRSDPDGSTRQPAVEPDVQSAYTTLIVRLDPTDRLCAVGAITIGARTETVPEPICT